MVRRLPIIALLLIVAALMGLRLRDPWVGAHDYPSAAFSTMARNHVRLGIGVTKLASVWNADRRDPQRSSFYIHHPFLYPVVLALPCWVLGSREWVFRAVAIACSLGSVLTLYLLMSRRFGRPTGWFAAAFFGLVPVTLYYGAVVSLEQPVVFLIILSIYWYTRWMETGSPQHYRLLVIAMVVGMLTEWQAYYLSALLPLHFLVYGGRREHRRLLGLAALGPLLFGLFLLHVALVQWSQFADLLVAFRMRTGSIPKGEQVALIGAAVKYTALEYLKYLWGYSMRLMGPVTLALAAAGTLHCLWKSVRNRQEGRWSSIPLLLLAPGAMHALVFHQAMFLHNYLVMLFLPGVAALAGLAMGALVAQGRASVPWCLAVVLMAAAVPTWVERTAAEHRKRSLRGMQVGRELAEATLPLDQILVLGMEYEAQLEWYADRNLFFVNVERNPLDLRDRWHISRAAVLKSPEDAWWQPRIVQDRARFALETVQRAGRLIRETPSLRIYELPPGILLAVDCFRAKQPEMRDGAGKTGS